MSTARVQFTGWDVGCKSISLVKLLSELAQIGLRDAQRLKEDIVAGEVVVISVPNANVERLVLESLALGFHCEALLASADVAGSDL